MKMFLTECLEFVGTTVQEFEGEKRYISTGALDKDHVNEADVELVTYENRPSRANLQAVAGDILFAKMANTEKTFMVDPISAEDIYSTGFCAVRANDKKILRKCLFYFLSSSLFLEQKDKNSSGATQKAITNSGLAQITITLPSLEEQQKFVGQMDLLNDAITARTRQLAMLDDLVKARFVEMFGDPVKNEMQWQTKSLEEACRIIVDCPHSTPNYTNEDTGFMCIRTSIVKKNRILWDEIEYICEDEYNKRIQRKRPEKGDVVYTREGAILGIAAVIDRDCNVALGQRSMLLSPDTEQCTPEFLSVAMNCDTFLDNALKGQSGSASPHINVGDIKAFKMIMPPVEQQRQFSAFIKQADKSKLAVQQSLGKLETLKKSLMQQYFG